jgi:uncharacterized NAD(P)/FAD-binding protein YdhS
LRTVRTEHNGKDGNLVQFEKETHGELPSGRTDGLRRGHHVDLAIVGGGFSGICTAWHLLTHEGLTPGFRCAIIEPGERLGAGLAYRTDSPHHLLNVRARGMSITAGDSGSFVRWLSGAASEYGPDDFVPRGLYRRYFVSCLAQAMEQQPDTVSVLQDEVLALVPETGTRGYLLQLKSGVQVRARGVVLAVGNLPPRSTLDNGLLCSPWGGDVDYRRIGTLAIVGAGLTALDVILEAEASGFAGRFHVISPHGQFPRCHREPFLPVPTEVRRWAEELAASRPRLIQALRSFQLQRKSGFHWEHLVDALRGPASEIWSGLDSSDKRHFITRLRGLWNIHLHRSCQRSIRVVNRLKEIGRLEQSTARVISVERREGSGKTAVRLLLQSDAMPALEADAAVNATGLYSDIRKTDSVLVAQLLEGGVAQPDELCLGLRVHRTGRLLSPDGSVWPDLFAVGTLRRGEELECTAVPEIRKQVAGIVAEIVARPCGAAQAE